MAYTPKTIHSGTQHDGYSTKDAQDLYTLINDIDTAIETAGDITAAAAATAAAITDSTGGSASQTLAALTNVDTLTDSTGGTADNTVGVSVGGLISNTVAVDASGGGSAQTTNCTNIPANSILVNVEAKVVTPFDGDTTTTLEVGVSGNADAYIDTSDFDPSAAADTVAGSAAGTNNDIKTVQYLGSATQLVATWTNDANATAGNVEVTTQYIVVGESSADEDLVDNNFKELVDQIITQKAFNTAVTNSLASIADDYNKLLTDVGLIRTAVNAIITALA